MATITKRDRQRARRRVGTDGRAAAARRLAAAHVGAGRDPVAAAAAAPTAAAAAARAAAAASARAAAAAAAAARATAAADAAVAGRGLPGQPPIGGEDRRAAHPDVIEVLRRRAAAVLRIDRHPVIHVGDLEHLDDRCARHVGVDVARHVRRHRVAHRRRLPDAVHVGPLLHELGLVRRIHDAVGGPLPDGDARPRPRVAREVLAHEIAPLLRRVRDPRVQTGRHLVAIGRAPIGNPGEGRARGEHVGPRRQHQRRLRRAARQPRDEYARSHRSSSPPSSCRPSA